ncbi:hypothetical protein ACRC7T_01765 [Segnochrobactraceae bacterium EtOH-i3]
MTTQVTRPTTLPGRTPEERAQYLLARRQELAARAEHLNEVARVRQLREERAAQAADASVLPRPRPTVVRPQPAKDEADATLVALDGVSPRDLRARRNVEDQPASRLNIAKLPGISKVPGIRPARPIEEPVDDEEEQEQDLPPPDVSGRDEALSRALPRRQTRIKLSVPLLSFLAIVILPTIVASIYYIAIAANQYVSEFKFSIRMQDQSMILANGQGSNTSSSADALQMMADNFVIIDYLRSRTALDELSKRIDFDHIYDTDKADWLSRLSSDASMESRLKYWQRTIDAAYDMTTGITTVTVRSFRPEDTLRVADSLVEMSEGLVNNLQARARHDAVAFFETEVARAEERLATAQRAVLDFRNKNQITDPSSSAEGVLGTYNKLQGDLVNMRAELASLLSSMKSNAPTVQVLKSRIAAAEVELGKLRARIGNNVLADGEGGRLSDVIDRYETLQREQAFAEKLYTSAITALEAARMSTAMQHNYLATFVQPALAHDSTYPNRFLSIISVLLIAVFAWIVVLLTGYAIRDHAI